MNWKNKRKLISILSLIIVIGTLGTCVKGSVGEEVVINIKNTKELKGQTLDIYDATKAIVEKHKNDFNYYNFDQKMKEYGGYKNYLKSLGGVFEKYADFNGRITTYSELEEVGNYVYGIMTIWGFDYSANGGKTYSAYYSHDDAFYPYRVVYGKENYEYMGIDEVASGGGYGMLANCALGVDWTLRKAGLIDKDAPPTYSPQALLNRYGGKIITNASELRPGDYLDIVTDGGGSHTTIVVARDDTAGTITLYDSGRGFLESNSLTDRYKSVKQIGEWPYAWAASWRGIRLPFNLIDDTNGKWLKDSKGVWFKRPDGSYPKGGWAKIRGYWYYFDKVGYVETGLKKINGSYYYLTDNANYVGRMLTGWQKINDKWYYFSPTKTSKYKEGAMVTGFNVINYKGSNNTYYFDGNGIMKTGWQKINNIWYYFDSSGVMQTGWLKTKDGAWYYLSKDSGTKGQMATGWKKLEYNGKMNWYYFAKTSKEYKGFKEGQMITGRHLVEYGGKYNYYYFCETAGSPNGYVKGAMLANVEYKGMKYDASGAYIDEVAPKVEVTYSIKEKTTKNVIVTLKANEAVQEISGWKLSEDRLTLTKEYSENKSEKVTVKDVSGNAIAVNIEVNNIDKTGPVLNVSYSETGLTNKGIIVTIKSNEVVKEVTGWKLSQDKLTLTKEYKTNVKEEIEVSDILGNKSKALMEINNIYETKLEKTKYTVDEDMIVVKNIGETARDFKNNNVATAQKIKIVDTNGVEMNEDSLIGTGCKIILDDTLIYRIVVLGDYDGDGKVGVREVAQIQKVILQEVNLEDIYVRALDLNENGRIDVSDLASICRLVKDNN